MKAWLRAVLLIYIVPLMIAAIGICIARFSTSNDGWTALGYLAFALMASVIWFAAAVLINLVLGIYHREKSRIWLAAIALVLGMVGWITHWL